MSHTPDARHLIRNMAALGGVALLGAALAACGSSKSTTSGGGTAGGGTIHIGLAVGKTGYLAAVDTPFGNGVNLAA